MLPYCKIILPYWNMILPNWTIMLSIKTLALRFICTVYENQQSKCINPSANVSLAQLSWALGWRNRRPTRQNLRQETIDPLRNIMTSWIFFSWFLSIFPKKRKGQTTSRFQILGLIFQNLQYLLCHCHSVPTGYGSCIYWGALYVRKDPSLSFDLWDKTSDFL